MKFLEVALKRVLEDLGIPYAGLKCSEGSCRATLDRSVPFSEVMEKVRENPKYGFNTRPHPWGVFLVLKKINCPEEQALVDISVDLRSSEGALVSVSATVMLAVVFGLSGENIVCSSLEALRQAAGEMKLRDTEERDYEALV